VCNGMGTSGKDSGICARGNSSVSAVVEFAGSTFNQLVEILQR
jgi:hypothetical protein